MSDSGGIGTVVSALLVVGVAAAAYYLLVHNRRKRKIQLQIPSSQDISGVYSLTDDIDTGPLMERNDYSDHPYHEYGEWKQQVWKHEKRDIIIALHTRVAKEQKNFGSADVWTILGWDKKTNNANSVFGYVVAQDDEVKKKVKDYKKSQTFGKDIGRTLNPLQSHEVLQYAGVSVLSPEEPHSSSLVGSIKIVD